jgi:hypothetical protein
LVVVGVLKLCRDLCREALVLRAMAGIATRVCKSWGRSFPLLQREAAPFGGSVRYSNVDASRGVGPVKGPENDSATKGSTPDDSRADEVHLVEPKDITKKKVAEAQEEPAGLQVPLAALSQTTYIADSPI